MIFIGGTALRFFHQIPRFSEDLDFNYSGTLKKVDLENMMHVLQRELQKENISMDFSIRKSQETYSHWKIYAQFPHILQKYGCGGRKIGTLHPEEKLSLQFDFQNLGTQKYPTTQKIIARFGKRFIFHTAELDMFLAEKSNAMLFRKSPRGRDFFDFMNLVELGACIDLQYLHMREIHVKNTQEYDNLLLKRVEKLDFAKLTDQFSPFLFRHEDVEIMKHFPKHLPDFLARLDLNKSSRQAKIK